MDPKKFGAPYREPCGGWPASPKLFLGGLYQHWRPADTAIDKHDNVTLVDGVAPYPKLNASGPAGGDCPGDPDCGVAGTCGTWSPDVVNSYDLNGTTSVAQCRKLGFKNAQARKVWHGRYGFLSHDPSGCASTLGGDCSDCSFEAEQVTPDQTKYRTVSREVSASWKCFNLGGSYTTGTQHYLQTTTVDKDSGVITLVACDFDDGPEEGCDNGGNIPGAGALLEASADCNGVIYAGEWTDKFADDYTPLACETVTKSVTNTEINLFYRSACVPGLDVFAEFSVAIKLSDPYSSADLWLDCCFLLAKWDLSDDRVYQWRTDRFVSAAPLVSRNEAPSPVSPDVGVIVSSGCPPWTDPNAATYDGTIRGAPKPAGYQGEFDSRHVSWMTCKGEDDVVRWWDAKFGSKSGSSMAGDSTDVFIPKCATQWTENINATALPPGAWVGMAGSNGDFTGGVWTDGETPAWGFGGGVMVMQKWAEISVRRPSYNFARPCGADATVIDQTTIDCVSNPTGDLRWADLSACSGQWDDDNPKGEYTYSTWTHNFRDYQERARVVAQYATCGSCSDAALDDSTAIRATQATHGMPQSVWDFTVSQECIGITACCPSVMFIGPDSTLSGVDAFTDFPFVNKYAFPPAVICDGRYGNLWQAAIKQHMVDPLWQAPVGACVECDDGPQFSECPQVEDDGGCHEDTCADDCIVVDGQAKYYARRPYVENRISVPVGAPSLPAGIYLNVLSLSDLASGSPPDGLVYTPPVIVGYTYGGAPSVQVPNPVDTPASIYIAEAGCVCAEGRFAADYEAQGVGCDG